MESQLSAQQTAQVLQTGIVLRGSLPMAFYLCVLPATSPSAVTRRQG